MMKHVLTILALTLAVGATLLAASGSHDASEDAAILRSFVEDFRNDPAAREPITFGVRVKDSGEWHVVVAGSDGDGPAEVTLRDGLPDEPCAIYVTDHDTLARIGRGEINALTAMGKAKSSDFAPLDIDAMEGFQPDGAFVTRIVPLTFHFWTRGTPEIILFGDKSMTREVHGGNVSIFYYQEGFRSAWVQIERGQHVNADPSDQVNPFPSMLVILGGHAQARIGGKEVSLEKGQALFIPPGVPHEFWNTNRKPAEAVLLMFGEGA